MPPAGASVLDVGDVLWIDFGPPFGHEQAGRRPAVVVTSRDYNSRSSLILVCPITRSPREWPFKVAIPPVGKLTGGVMVDQIRAIDQRMRSFGPYGRVPDAVVMEIRARLAALLGLPFTL
jgi:mRNA interferase MazF